MLSVSRWAPWRCARCSRWPRAVVATTRVTRSGRRRGRRRGAAPVVLPGAGRSTRATTSSSIPTSATAKAGEVTIEHDNDGATTHTFVIDEHDFKLVDDDATDIELAAGDYVFYCDVPGHREAGMEGTLTVTP